MDAERICARCKSTTKIESHHIIFKSRGGSDDESNRKDYCKACHTYTHTRFAIVEYLDFCKSKVIKLTKVVNKLNSDDKYYKSILKSFEYYKSRVTLVEYRLNVLDKLNTVRNIKKYGYRSYWTDPNTHGSDGFKFKKKPRKRKK